MKLFKLFGLMLAIFVLSSCATITRGSKDTLVIESDPAGANVEISNGMSGKTPSSFKMSRKHPVVVKIAKEGYETIEVNVTPQVCGAGGAGMAGNVLIGGLIGAGIDACTGAMNNLKPNPISVKLNPLLDKEAVKDDSQNSTITEEESIEVKSEPKKASDK